MPPIEGLPPLAATDRELFLAQTMDIWPRLFSADIFLTGGTGFFGTWLVESWCWAKSNLKLQGSLTILTRTPELFKARSPHLTNHPGIRLVTGDIRSFKLAKAHFDVLIHAATPASAYLNDNSPQSMFDTIVTGTRRILEFALNSGVTSILYVSSGAIYGKQPPNMPRIHEDYASHSQATDQNNAYADGKRAAELMCIDPAILTEARVTIARCFAFVGPHLPLDTHFAIGNFVRDGLVGGPIRIQGDGTPVRSYLYAGELTTWLWTILVKGRQGVPYNVGSMRDLPLLEVAALVASLCNDCGVSVATEAMRTTPPLRYVPDTHRANVELGLSESLTLAESIRRTLAWHRTR